MATSKETNAKTQPAGEPQTHESDGGCSDTSSEDVSGKLCIFCNQVPIEYKSVPCGHKTACKKCAMRMATGGKCRVCKEFYGDWERVNK